MGDDRFGPKESTELIASVAALIAEGRKRRFGPPREEQLILRLRAALLGRTDDAFFETSEARLLCGGPVAKAYNLFVHAVLGQSVVDDREAVLTVVAKAGEFLEFASADLRDDKDVFLSAVGQHSRAAQFVGAHLAEDKALLLSLPWMPPLSALPAKYRDDRDVVIRNGDLAAASERLRDDKDLVIFLITHQPSWGSCPINSASERLRRDPQVIAADEKWRQRQEDFRRIW